MQRRKVVLPDPLGPMTTDDLAALHLHIDPAQHLIVVEVFVNILGVHHWACPVRLEAPPLDHCHMLALFLL